MSDETDALKYHSEGRKGKIEVIPTKPCVTQRDLSLAYSPGVAWPCLKIKDKPQDAYKYTAKGNLVAVISNGTAVLGLGNIGALAGKPVMEGKGVLFKKFADIDVFDIEVDTTDPDKFCETVKLLEPTFGGINLEDIKAPECFYIEEKLKKEMNIPIFHDDQHGTAIISSAGLLNALEITGKKIEEIKVVFSGAGASGVACAELYISLGVKRENLTMCDSRGVIYKGREQGMNKFKDRFALETEARTLADALVGADVFTGVSQAGVMTQEMVKSMNDKPIIFAMANPDPEITYFDAKAAREDCIMATGRSDYPNQVNNVLGFPFIFRGALDVSATSINEEMKIAAVRALAKLAKEPVPDSVLKAYGVTEIEFGDEYIIPKPFDPRVLINLAPAVAKAAMASGVATRPIEDFEKYVEELKKIHGPREFTVRRIINRVKKRRNQFVFPEGENEKILRASHLIVDENIGTPILLGNEAVIRQKAQDLNIDLNGTEIIDPVSSPNRGKYAQRLFELRQRKGVTLSSAQQILKRNIYYGMMMLEQDDTASLLSGVSYHYPDTIRPALEIIKLREGLSTLSSFFLVMFKESRYIFADTTVNIDPTAEQLSEIAISCANAAKTFGMDPKIAMLSFSNFGSVKHPSAEKMALAAKLVAEKRPDLEVDGEMQADTAVSPELINEFYSFASIKGKANILIFPELQSANISYKLMEQLGQAELVGPLLVGMKKPVNVLQRGCSVEYIVNMAAVTALEIENGTF